MMTNSDFEGTFGHFFKKPNNESWQLVQLLTGDPSAVTPWQAEESEPKVDQEPSVAAQAWPHS